MADPTPTLDPLLVMLKIDLGISATVYDTRLAQILTAAKAEIVAAGASTLDETAPQDAQLIVMYAAWMWRRRDEQAGMPRMVQFALNNRVFAEKMRGDSA